MVRAIRLKRIVAVMRCGRVNVQLAEVTREGLVLLRADALIAEEQHLVPHPSVVDRSHLVLPFYRTVGGDNGQAARGIIRGQDPTGGSALFGAGRRQAKQSQDERERGKDWSGHAKNFDAFPSRKHSEFQRFSG